jgi:hypothetical protein
MYVAPFIAVLIFLVNIILAIKFRIKLGYPKVKFIGNLIIGLVMVITIAIPPLTYLPIKEKCSKSNSAKIPALSQALEKYYRDNERYPEELDELVPEYLSALPKPSCHYLCGMSLEFRLRACEGYEPEFFVRTIDLVGYDFYSFEDGEHSRVHSFLDFPDPGHCP